jgi:hypothetical protein
VALGLGWTIILIVLAACGLLGAEGAIVAAVVHNLSTLLGMANSGRLLRFDETGLVAPRRRTAASLAAQAADQVAAAPAAAA